MPSFGGRSCCFHIVMWLPFYRYSGFYSRAITSTPTYCIWLWSCWRAGIFNAAPDIHVPVYVSEPVGAPPLFPVLFITVACGAISGFHSLVSSGTSSKQLQKESSSQLVGYGSMLLEGLLALLVIVACTAGIEMGIVGKDGEILHGMAAFSHHYADWNSASGLGAKVGGVYRRFRESACRHRNTSGFCKKPSLPFTVVAFAATTLDTATRLQRYALNELGQDFSHQTVDRYPFADVSGHSQRGGALFFRKAEQKGGMVLWPVFGTTNQLLALLGTDGVECLSLSYQASGLVYPRSCHCHDGDRHDRDRHESSPVRPERTMVSLFSYRSCFYCSKRHCWSKSYVFWLKERKKNACFK